MSSNRGTPAVELVERALELLLAAPARVHLVHLAGSAPFVFGLTLFVLDLGLRGRTRVPLIVASGLLALAYLLMKVTQNLHARMLLRRVVGEPGGETDPREAWRAARAQLVQQPHALWLLPLAAFALLPYGWVSTYFQSLTVTGETRSARRLALLWPLQIHTALLVLTLFGLIVFLDAWVALLVAPSLLRTLLGVETAASLAPTGLLDVVPAAAAAALTYLLVSPLQRAVHVLRVAEGASRSSGADLLAELRRLRSAARAAALALALALAAGVAHAQAQPDPGPQLGNGESMRPEPLDRALDRVLDRPEFDWKRKRSLDLEGDPSWLAAFWRAIGDGVTAVADWIGELLERLARWLRGREPGAVGAEAGSGGPPAWRILALLALVALAAAAVLAWRARRRRSATIAARAAPVEASPLELEERDADRLASDEWLRVAADLERAGDLRGAARAVHLAALSCLSRAGWVRLAAFKTNRDYERELRRRARSTPLLAEAWSGAVAGIEPVWYGTHAASRELVAELRECVRELERHAPAA